MLTRPPLFSVATKSRSPPPPAFTSINPVAALVQVKVEPKVAEPVAPAESSVIVPRLKNPFAGGGAEATTAASGAGMVGVGAGARTSRLAPAGRSLVTLPLDSKM